MATPDLNLATELSLRYIEHLNSADLPRFMRRAKQEGRWRRLTVDDIPFWSEVQLSQYLQALRHAGRFRFVNVDANPFDFGDYLKRTVPYADTIVLQDPISTMYEWADRGTLDEAQFLRLGESVVDNVIALYPLVESGIVAFVPEPRLWSAGMNTYVDHVVGRFFEGDDTRGLALSDPDTGRGEEDLIEEWLSTHGVPRGWKDHSREFATVNILSGVFEDLANGLVLADALDASTTSKSTRTWRLASHAGAASKTGSNELVSSILPLLELPYPETDDWQRLIEFREREDLVRAYRQAITKSVEEISRFGSDAGTPEYFASKVSEALCQEIATARKTHVLSVSRFGPPVLKSLLAAYSAIVGSDPLSAALGVLAVVDGMTLSREYLARKGELRRNPLFFLFR